MNAKIISLLLMTSCFFGQVNSQTLEIDYDQTITYSEIGIEMKHPSKLVANTKVGYYTIFYSTDQFYSSPITTDEDGNGHQTTIFAGDNTNHKQNFITGELISEEGRVLIKESTKDLKWEFIDSTKVILDYKCKAARTLFKGREYIAYYTTEIPINGGPWKFGGLPGMILETKSTDGVLAITAVGLKQKNKLEEIDLGEETKTILTWSQFVTNTKKSIEKANKKIQSEIPGELNSMESKNYKVELFSNDE